MKRELKVKELQLLDATRRRFLKQQQDLQSSQIQRLDQEIKQKVNAALYYRKLYFYSFKVFVILNSVILI